MSPAEETASILRKLGVEGHGALACHSPIDGSRIGSVAEASDVAAACERAQAAFLAWRSVPAPRRGERDPTGMRRGARARRLQVVE